MTNPWLGIPLSDYLGHMGSPVVDQEPVLNRLLGEAVARSRPAAVLVLGCSTGNGLEHVDPAVTRRVVVVDVNAVFLRVLVERFPHPAFALEVLCADAATAVFEPNAFDLVHAALLFEYVDWPSLVPRLAGTLRPGGTLSVVVQLPSASTPAVTPTGFTSLLALESIFRFVDADLLVGTAAGVGLTLEQRRTEPLKSAKAFEVLRFTRE